jgi:hypothetical protein
MAARSMTEFVMAQIRKLGEKRPPRRRAGRRPVDASLHLDSHRYVAWTTDGHLVSIDDPVPGELRSSPIVRFLSAEERRDILGANRLVSIVVQVFGLERGPVFGYLAHIDLRAALDAALARATREEVASAQANASQPHALLEHGADPLSVKPGTNRGRRRIKSRSHPLGNYVLLRAPRGGELVPAFAAISFGCPVPEAFADRRQAERTRDSLVRQGVLEPGCEIVRVLGSVKVRPRFRKGVSVPRSPEAMLKLIRHYPDVVAPELAVAWQPRFLQDEDGVWRRKTFRHRVRTVRHALHLARVARVATAAKEFGSKMKFDPRREARHAKQCGSPSFARALEDARQELIALRAFMGEERRAKTGDRYSALHQAQRLVPRSWLPRIGLDPFEIPNLRSVLESPLAAPPSENGHWLRAPFEFKAAGDRKARRRLVELPIDDLAGLLGFGMEIEFWLIKESTRKAPRWVMPIREWAVPRSVAG